MTFFKRSFARVLALMILCVVVMSYQEVGASTDARTINNMLNIIPRIDIAEEQRIVQEPKEAEQKPSRPNHPPSSEALLELQEYLIPNNLSQATSYWIMNYALSDLLYYVSDTVGKDALYYIYKINYDGYRTPLSTVLAPIYSVDLKGMYDGSMVGVVESKKNGLAIKILLSAYYTSDDFYGYETFAYDYVNDEPLFLEHNKYDKHTDDFVHMHILKESGSRNTKSSYIVDDKFLPDGLSASASVADILYNELMLTKSLFFGEKPSEDDTKKNDNPHSNSIMGKFRTKSEEVKDTYIDKDGIEQTLQFDDSLSHRLIMDSFIASFTP